DMVITHGPPLRLHDPIDEPRIQCQALRDAVAVSRPRLRCLGHNQPGWGATVVNWKE
ncbi:hypothetical protein M406DRAFT_222914, partial [Cryphonectria parasitica EP155]